MNQRKKPDVWNEWMMELNAQMDLLLLLGATGEWGVQRGEEKNGQCCTKKRISPLLCKQKSSLSFFFILLYE